MRYVFYALSATFLVFAGLQWNDPDAFLWMSAYVVPAGWLMVAAAAPSKLYERSVTAALAATLGLFTWLTVMLWPLERGWWRADVWWSSEAAREGMGLILMTLALLAVVLRRTRQSR